MVSPNFATSACTPKKKCVWSLPRSTVPLKCDLSCYSCCGMDSSGLRLLHCFRYSKDSQRGKLCVVSSVLRQVTPTPPSGISNMGESISLDVIPLPPAKMIDHLGWALLGYEGRKEFPRTHGGYEGIPAPREPCQSITTIFNVRQATNMVAVMRRSIMRAGRDFIWSR